MKTPRTLVRLVDRCSTRFANRRLLASLLIAGSSLFALSAFDAAAQTVVAHRGASAHAPENTLAAFHLAFAEQADAIEADVMLTADGQLIICHDKTTKRVTAGQTDWVVAEKTMGELKTLDVGSWKDPAMSHLRMPSLAETLAVVPEGKQVFLDIKAPAAIAPMLVHQIEQSSLTTDQVVVIAFDAEVVKAVKALNPAIKACWLTSLKTDKNTGQPVQSNADILATLAECDADGLDSKADLKQLENGLAQAVMAAGYELHVWTVNDAETAQRLQRLGVASITTDAPAMVRETLNQSQPVAEQQTAQSHGVSQP